MITSIRLKNFKNFADETLRVGPFTILVGANASGKSNIRDAFRLLHGIGRGYSLAEIFGGKREAGWKPIRGAMDEIIRFGHSSFALEVGLKLSEAEFYYSIEVGCSTGVEGEMSQNGLFRVTKEKLEEGSRTIYSAIREDNESLRIMGAKLKFEKVFLKLEEEQPVLSALAPHFLEPLDTAEWTDISPALVDAFEILDLVTKEFARMRFLELSPERMREPSFPGAAMLGDDGENLPTVLQKLCADTEKKKILASWLQELTPMDVEEFKFPRDPSGRVHLQICERKVRKVSAYSASDGTLRFLGLLAVLLGDNPNSLYFFEEIDTGIHPARQRLLLEMIEKQVAKGNVQVVTTTHAPDLLTFVNDSTFENMSVVCRLEDSQDAIIRRIAELPNARKLRTSQGGLGRLLTSRWMETTLAFTEDYDEAGDDS